MQNSKSIIQTLLYFEIFSFAPNFDELHKFLIGEKISKKKLQAKLTNNEYIESKRGMFFLKGKNEISNQRRIRQIISREKRVLAQDLIHILSRIPTIQSIALSGSVACDNAHENDDIDLFIITSPGSVWFTRFLVYSLLKILGRMRGKGNTKNLFCPNMFISLSNLEISEKNLYTASEIGHLVPLLDKNESFMQFLISNKWIHEYFPNFVIPKSYIKSNIHSNSWLLKFDKSLFYFQTFLMKKKITNEKIQIDRIQFHPNNLSFLILKLWESRKYAYYKSIYFRKVAYHGNSDEIHDHTPGS